MSTSAGTWFSDKMTTTEILTEIINDILNEPLRLYQVLNGCAKFVNGSNFATCRVVACGPPTADVGLVTSLRTDTNAEIILHEEIPCISSPLRLNQTPRTSKKQKLAIVGMAGRFPNAADHEKFWDLLYAGLDVHREVSAVVFLYLPSLTNHRSQKTASMSRNTTIQMAKFGILAILPMAASSTNLAYLIPASSTCHLEKRHKRILCIGSA